jgi:hypothetical protein
MHWERGGDFPSNPFEDASMAKEEGERSLISSGSINESFLHEGAAVPHQCTPRAPTHALPSLDRLTGKGQATVVAATLLLYISIFLLSRLEEQRRQSELGYCNRVTLELVSRQVQANTRQKDRAHASAWASWERLSKALPTASKLQVRRMTQQVSEANELFRYHCKSMGMFSADFQSLVMVANGAGILALGILAWLSRQPRQQEMQWPLPLIVTSACSFTVALVTIKTFKLQENMLNSRSLTQQSRGIARGYATSLANLTEQQIRNAQRLAAGSSIGELLEQMDSQLALIDRSAFTISDQLDEKGAQLLYQQIAPDRK